MKRAQHSQQRVLVVLLALLLGGLGGCTYTWRPNWWNFYERGLSRASEGQLQEAVEAFETAVGEKEGATLPRPEDARRARTYGLHFVDDYFPHRELGVAFYRMKRYAEAERELLVSLSQTPSAKAKTYLNLVRRELLRQTPAQEDPPTLEVNVAGAPYISSNKIRVTGVAMSRNRIESIAVNGRRLFIELAEQETPFSTEVQLKPGPNEVVVQAVDLLGKSTEKRMSLTVDVQYPGVAIEDVARKNANTVTISGLVMDNTGLTKLVIEGRERRIERPLTEVAFDVEAAVEDTISIVVTDLAGNRTSADVLITADMLEQPGQEAARPILLAMAGPGGMADSGAMGLLLSQATRGQDRAKPILKLRDVVEGRVIYDEEFIFDGMARDNGRLAALSVNGEDILRPRTGVLVKHFTYRALLETGKNEFTVVAVDKAGNRTERRFTVERRIQEPLQVACRLTLGLLPLQQTGSTLSATAQVYNLLLASFLECGRFNLVEREEAVFKALLTELRIANSQLADKTTALRIGRMKTAEGMIYGKTVEDARSITVDLWLVDTETSEILFFADVYGEDKSRDELRWLMDGLVLKFKQHFPLVRGKVTRVTESGMFINNGAVDGIWPGMKYLVLEEDREAGAGVLMLKELDGKMLEARARTVQPESCFAECTDKSAVNQVRVSDPVITK